MVITILCTQVLPTTSNPSIKIIYVLKYTILVMNQRDKLNKFANVSSYTISKLQALLYLMPKVSECKFETK